MIQALCSLIVAVAFAGTPKSSPVTAINAVIDDWHAAAAKADEVRYFSHFAPDAVFIGTDASERWPVKEFRKYTHARFKAGTAWTIVPKERHVSVSADGKFAWFDEAVVSLKWGPSRGSGVLMLIGKEWKIAQYNYSVPIPNDLLAPVTAMIKGSAVH